MATPTVPSDRTVSTDPEDRIYARRWGTLAVLSLSLVIIGLDNTILNVALPTLQRTFSASAADLQWMVDAYVLVFAGLLLTMGALGDRFGRARALQAGLILFAVSSIAATFSTETSHLIAARVAMGIGGALIMPSTLSIIVNVFPPAERRRAIAIWAGVSGLGVGLGPLIGGLLIENFSWSSVSGSISPAPSSRSGPSAHSSTGSSRHRRRAGPLR